MIFDVPIEPLAERYSIQWASYFTDAYLKHKIPWKRIAPEKPLTSSIETGAFLDVHGTNWYKACQLQLLVEALHKGEIKDGDWIFFHDLWFPGIEMLAYIRDGSGVRFGIAGCLHAGTWDPHDFLTRRGMRSWGKLFEKTLFQVADLAFVATCYHQEIMLNYLEYERWLPRTAVMVTGFPINTTWDMDRAFEGRTPKDPNLVVFPHRLDPEKQPRLFNELAAALKDTPLRFVKTKEIAKTKTEYYAILARARYAVSFAQQETWGIAMQEALFSGCIPLVPSRLSYREMYSDTLQFASLDKLVNLLRTCTEPSERGLVAILLEKAAEDRRKLLMSGKLAIERMLSCMRVIK